MFLMPGDAILPYQGEKVARAICCESGTTEFGILRKKVDGAGMYIGEIAAPAARDTDFLGQARSMVHQNHTGPALTGYGSRHHSRRAGSYDDDIECLRHGPQ